jgi:hypothetical protein
MDDELPPNAKKKSMSFLWVPVLVGGCSLLAIGGLSVALLDFNPVRSISNAVIEPRHQATCHKNLSQIVMALNDYHLAHKEFPPPFTKDSHGKPLHSWRTLILPHLGQKTLYDKIDLSKPWDSPANAEIMKTHLAVYSCPSSGLGPGLTTYQAIVGTEAFMSPEYATKIAQFFDGTSNTIALIDVDPKQAVHWMSPEDNGKEAFLAVQPNSRLQHPGGIHAAFTDGVVRLLLIEKLDQTLRKALITRQGGEVIETPK